MVERSESDGLKKFIAIVKTVEAETGAEGRTQYHITMEPEGLEIKGATGALHEWIPMSTTATESSVPQGSVMDRYLSQVEICIEKAEKAKTIADALKLMVGKKFQFHKRKLGKDFEGHKAREYAVPTALIE